MSHALRIPATSHIWRAITALLRQVLVDLPRSRKLARLGYYRETACPGGSSGPDPTRGERSNATIFCHRRSSRLRTLEWPFARNHEWPTVT